jgi:hypothetical protein
MFEEVDVCHGVLLDSNVWPTLISPPMVLCCLARIFYWEEFMMKHVYPFVESPTPNDLERCKGMRANFEIISASSEADEKKPDFRTRFIWDRPSGAIGPYLPPWLRDQYRQAAADCKSNVPLIRHYHEGTLSEVQSWDLQFVGGQSTIPRFLVIALDHGVYVGHVYVFEDEELPDALLMMGIRVALWTRFMTCSTDKPRPQHALRSVVEGVRQYAVRLGKKRIRTAARPIGMMPDILGAWGWKGDVYQPMETYDVNKPLLLGVELVVLPSPPKPPKRPRKK